MRGTRGPRRPLGGPGRAPPASQQCRAEGDAGPVRGAWHVFMPESQLTARTRLSKGSRGESRQGHTCTCAFAPNAGAGGLAGGGGARVPCSLGGAGRQPQLLGSLAPLHTPESTHANHGTQEGERKRATCRNPKITPSLEAGGGSEEDPTEGKLQVAPPCPPKPGKARVLGIIPAGFLIVPTLRSLMSSSRALASL